jgi:hypothetical protein
MIKLFMSNPVAPELNIFHNNGETRQHYSHLYLFLLLQYTICVVPHLIGGLQDNPTSLPHVTAEIHSGFLNPAFISNYRLFSPAITEIAYYKTVIYALEINRIILLNSR